MAAQVGRADGTGRGGASPLLVFRSRPPRSEVAAADPGGAAAWGGGEGGRKRRAEGKPTRWNGRRGGGGRSCRARVGAQHLLAPGPGAPARPPPARPGRRPLAPACPAGCPCCGRTACGPGGGPREATAPLPAKAGCESESEMCFFGSSPPLRTACVRAAVFL